MVSIIDKHYDYTTDWKGKRYLGLTLDWDYVKRKVRLSMPGYVPNALGRFKKERPKKPQAQPHTHTPPNYGVKMQHANEEKGEEILGEEETKIVQQVCGTFLYYGRAVYI